MVQRGFHSDYLKLTGLLCLIAFGLIAQRAGWIDFSPALQAVEAHAYTWWAPLLLVLLKVLMYALALPASTLILLAGVLYSPLIATGLTIVGGVLGGLAAYHLVHFFSAEFIERRTDTPLVKFLKDQAGWAELCAIRILPGFPHSVINYSAGVLHIPRIRFTISAAVGFAVKGFVYTSAVHRATHVEAGEELLTLQTLWPLIAIALLLVGGAWAKKTFQQ